MNRHEKTIAVIIAVLISILVSGQAVSYYERTAQKQEREQAWQTWLAMQTKEEKTMKAYIEVYDDGNIIKICRDDDTVIDRYEVKNLYVEIRKEYIEVIHRDKTIPINTGSN